MDQDVNHANAGRPCFASSLGHLAQRVRPNYRYTDKRTAVCYENCCSHLDAKRSVTLGSAHHDQANQIHQYSRRRSKSRARFLHRQTWVHDHHRPAFRREAALDRITNSEGGDTRGVIYTGRGGKPDRVVYEHVIHVRPHREDIRRIKKRGVEFEGPPQKQPWGTSAMFKVSEGNRFVLSSE